MVSSYLRKCVTNPALELWVITPYGPLDSQRVTAPHLALERLHQDVRALARLVLAEARLEVPHGPAAGQVLHLLRRQLRLREHGPAHARLQ